MSETPSRSLGNGGKDINPSLFRKDLIAWGRKNFRSFPWRFTRQPYRVLLAEIMLHRTQANQVRPVYEWFVEKYPDTRSLAQASREQLSEELSSLGLRWRAELVHAMALQLLEQYGGYVPYERSDLLSLPGVSDYIASAVRCFAWEMPDPVVDTNTVRVTGRLYGLEIKDSSRRNRVFRDLISGLLDPDRPREYNFALLDLAALICTKAQPPKCIACPVRRYCEYGMDPLTPKRS